MDIDKPVRRMTFRQLLTHAEKCSRDLIEHCRVTLLSRINDFRDLSRPVRRRSQYPTLLSVQNALRQLQQASEEVLSQANYLQEHLEAIRDQANRERVSRL